MKNYLIYTFLFLGILFFGSCEDVIKVDLEGSKPQLVVEAFINDSLATQRIKLSMTKSYLDNGIAPSVTGAEVSIEDIVGRKFIFSDADNNGIYEWNPGPTDIFPLGIPGLYYQLKVKYNGEQFSAVAKMDSVPPIDSLGYEYNEQEIIGQDTIKAGYTLTMLSRDIPNQTNGYWFKTFKNGKFFNKPGDMNLAYDAAFGPGSDGVNFIAPIIFNLSPERYKIGDTLSVECHSIGIPTYYFMSIAQSQMLNGGLFASPVVNSPSNIQNMDSNSKVKALGWFCMESISRKGVRIKQ